jgi:undecaprenyl-diphosphatase
VTVLQSIILGIIQGLTEFLPISSSGHLVLFQKIFGLQEGVVTFDVAVHVATLVGIVIVLRKEIQSILKKPLGKLTWLIVAGTIPTVIIAVVFKDLIDRLFASGSTLGFEFIFTGLVLWYAESVRSRNKGVENTTYMDAAFIGVGQGIAILPAISRSGLTLAGALMRGLNREFALKFSFLLSIPAILGAAALDGYDMVKGGMAGAGVETLPLIIGMLAAGISGYFAVKFMLKVFSKASLKVFSYYVFILGILIIADQFIFKIVF